MVREGADSGTLRTGHWAHPGTALPGRMGNVGLAGHRDTFFRALRNIEKDDTIDFETDAGTYRYSVQSTRIVSSARCERSERGRRARFDAGYLLSVLLCRIGAQAIYRSSRSDVHRRVAAAGGVHSGGARSVQLGLPTKASTNRRRSPPPGSSASPSEWSVFRPSISAASFLLPRVFFRACSRMFRSMPPTVFSKSKSLIRHGNEGSARAGEASRMFPRRQREIPRKQGRALPA